MSLSWARNSVLVNSTSTMPVALTKLVMSASVTVRPIVLNCRPTGRSSKKKPRPTVSTRYSPACVGAKRPPSHGFAAGPSLPRKRGRVITPSPACGGGLGWGLDLDHALVLQPRDLARRQPEPGAVDLGVVLAHSRARAGRRFGEPVQA